jgi:ABC-2 type transport system permease protein
VTAPGSIAWFARHEARLAWREWVSHMTGGRRSRVVVLAIGSLFFLLFMHGLARVLLARPDHPAGTHDVRTLAVITSVMALSFSGMVSQALVLVTRAFYARGDLELVLTSPADASRLFAVRIIAIAATLLATTVVMAAPFINVLAWLRGARWLWTYAVAISLAVMATTLAVLIVGVLFNAVGARRTRTAAQVIAAVIGVAFAIGVQFVAIFSTGALTAPHWAVLERLAPDPESLLWRPARAAFGEPVALGLILTAAALSLFVVVRLFAARFGELALAAGGVFERQPQRKAGAARFRVRKPAQALRRKEWLSLLRDPWLISQTLMQLLYLIPVCFLLWQNFSGAGVVVTILVPMTIMTAGQIGGGLAWLALSAEDAPDLLASAPLSRAAIIRAKGEAVLGGVAILFSPLLLALAIVSPREAAVAFCGAMTAAASAAAIQYWFRIRATRLQFHRRQTSSRLALYAEALTTTGWAGVGALAAVGAWAAVAASVGLLLLLLLGAWLVSPSRDRQEA